MPQLVPFYFLNMYVYGIMTIVTLLLINSYYVLPMLLRLHLVRLFISKM